jgi:hypothetical protein
MAENNKQNQKAGDDRKNVTSSFLKSIGLINPVQDRLKLKTLKNIESSAKIALFNAKRIKFLFTELFKQIQVGKLDKPKTTTDVSIGKKLIEKARSGFKVSSLLKGLLLVIPLISLLIDDEIKKNLSSYFSELLKAFGVTDEALKLIKWAIGSLDDLLKLYLGYKVISKVIKFFKLLITLGKIIKFALKLLIRNCGMGLPMPDVPEPGRTTQTPRPAPGPTAPRPVPPVASPYQLLPPPSRPSGGIRIPPPVPPSLPGMNRPALPAPAGTSYQPTPSRPALPQPAPTPSQTGRISNPADIEDAKIIRETLKPGAPGGPGLSTLGNILHKISRFIPIINLIVGAYDLYLAYKLYEQGKTKEAVTTALAGMGAILLGVGSIIAAPVLGPILTGIGLIASVASFVGWAGSNLIDMYESGKDYRYQFDSYDYEPIQPYQVAPDETSLRLNNFSTDINLARTTSRPRDTEVVIITKPVIVFNQAFA